MGIDHDPPRVIEPAGRRAARSPASEQGSCRSPPLDRVVGGIGQIERAVTVDGDRLRYGVSFCPTPQRAERTAGGSESGDAALSCGYVQAAMRVDGEPRWRDDGCGRMSPLAGLPDADEEQ